MNNAIIISYKTYVIILISDIQAATLLSVSAGCDTVFRVISGFVLDLKTFRSIRPLIYNVFTFMQAVTAVLFPLMTSYTEFLLLCIFEGAVLGIKNAQVFMFQNYLLHNILPFSTSKRATGRASNMIF